ncbi:MAG: LPS export ABC transporter periplasmic protein LptC [Acidobacteriota bacterium]|nr:LPS export ABC transporter periplasmic protein LptC [Acidobacteriota bacterium]
MQRTIRVLRIALPIAFVAFVAYLVANWSSKSMHKPRTPGDAVTSTQRPDDTPRVEGRAFRDVQTIGGRVVSEISASRVVGFESGWSTLEGVTLTIHRQNGLTYVLSCPQAQFNGKTKEAEAKGGVRVTSTDNVEIRTDEIRYDGVRLTNDVAVNFKVDRWNGQAGALELDVAGETLRLHKNVDATMAAATPAEQPMNIKGAESIFRRRENVVEFNQHVDMTRGADNLRADVMVARFTPDRKQLVGFEGHGNTVIVTAANTAPGDDMGGRKEITCDAFNTEVGPDGQINAINALSQGNLSHAVLSGPPMRDIVARNFRIALANKIVSEVRADAEVVMKEIAPQDTRQVNADRVTVWFDAATRRARTAYLEGGVRYADAKNRASAFRANYDITGDRLILTTDTGWQATVVADGQILKAKQIEFSPRAQTAHASGSVIAQLVGKGKAGGASADGTNLFPANKPVFVNADDLIMRQAQKIAQFTGNVKAWQDNNTLLAQEMQVLGAGDSITARGGVRTLLYNTTAEARRTPMQTTSEQLVARRAERRVELTGKVNIVDETRNLKADKATLFLDESRKVQKMEAETGVQMAESATGRKGTGDRAVYEVEKKMIYVFGNPATISDPKGNVSGQQIVFDVAKDRVQVLSSEGKTKGTYKHEG